MASQINVTPASQVANVEVNNRELSVSVQRESKLVDITLETRGNISVDISRSMALTGVQEIVAGNNITISPSGGTGTVTINAIQTGNVEHAETANVANVANSVAGANVTGQVGFAAIANSVMGSNVAGAVAYATTANSVAGANVVGLVSNAIHAAVADSANSVAGANVTGTVNLATYATTANSVAGANVTGQVSFAAVANSIAAGNIVGSVANAIRAESANVSDSTYSVSGSNVSGTVNSATYAAVANSVAGANVAGYVANATHANIADQANTVGTLVNLTVTGNVHAGNILTDHLRQANGDPYVFTTNAAGSNTQVQFNTEGSFDASQYFTFNTTTNTLSATNIAGNGSSLTHLTGGNVVGDVSGANHANVADVANSVSGSNVSGDVSGANHANVADVANSVAAGNITGTINYATYAGTANSVAGSNVAGYVANATHANIADSANSVAGSNVTGQVSYAAVANSVSGSNVSGYVANANHANIADSANSVSGSNVSGAVNLATYATTANSVAGANVSGIVANATHATNADSATTATSATTAGTVTTAAQPNITSLGTVVGLTSSANISAPYFIGNVVGNISGNIVVPGTNTAVLFNNEGNAGASDSFKFDSASNIVTVLGNVNANYFIGNGSQLSHITAGNIDGQVANSLVAGTVYSSSQPNITSLGTLNSLTVTGNVQSYANISGAYIFGDGSYLTGIGNLSAANGYWGSFYSNATQTIASTTTSYVVTLNNSDPDSHGVYISSNSHINFQFAGTYNLQFSAQFDNASTNVEDTSVWLRKNGVDVIDSRGQISIPAKHAGTNGQIIESWNYIIKLAAGDYLELAWQAQSTNVSMAYLGAGTTPTTPASPSIIVTAQQVTNVQPVELQGAMTGDIIGNGHSLLNIASISSVDGITANTFTGNGAPLTHITGANVTGYVPNATHANISDVANSVAGSNVSGQVANSLVAGTVYTAAQPNITSLGSLTSLSMAGDIIPTSNVTYSLGNNTNRFKDLYLSGSTIYIDGSTISTDITGNIKLGNLVVDSTNGTIAGATVTGYVANANVANTAQSVAGANVTGQVGFAAIANSVMGSNVTGAVAYASVANSVAGANVVGLVSNATHAAVADVANSVSGSNVTGEVNFAAVANSVSASNISGTINYATYAGTANSVAGANVTGEVSFAATANSVSASNISGTINYATYAGTANSVAGANVSGAVAYATTANSVAGANVSGVVANATHATSADSATTATSATTASSATVADSANSVSGSNVSGQVGNALIAGTVYSSSQPNITSLGTLTGLSSSGDIFTQSKLLVGNGSSSLSFNNPTIIGYKEGSDFIQAALINALDTGSADWVSYGDNGSDLGAWSDMGFTGSGFNDYNYTITGPNDGYFFVQGDVDSINGGNLVIATGSQGSTRDIVFATGGFESANEFMRIYNGDGTARFLTIGAPTPSTDQYTGALVVTGGVGISGDVHFGADAHFYDVAALRVPGGTGGQVLTTDGLGNLSFTTIATSAGGSNTQVQFNDNGSFGGVANLTFDKTTNTLSATNIAGNGAGLSSITGANVSGAVSFATTANSVAVGNVSGIGNIATINLTGSTSNVLYGNGTFAAIPTVTSVANATAANTILSNSATTATVYPTFVTSSTNGWSSLQKVSGISANLAANSITATTFTGNLTGTANNATVAATANTSLGSNVTLNTATVGTYYPAFLTASSGNSGVQADTGLTYSPSTGTLTAGSFVGSLNANNLSSGTVPSARISGALPSVTSLSNTGLTVYNATTTGVGTRYLLLTDVTGGTGGLDTATGITANASNSSITATTFVGALSGAATSATTAVTVTASSQPNITSTGTLVGANVNGTVTASRLVSNVATGTAPFTVTSTTRVANLNVATAGTADTATSATTAGTVTTAAQPNITSLGTLTSITTTGTATANTLVSSGSAGDEGGEIRLALAQTGTTLSTSVTVDIYQNKLRFFETGGTNRGAYIDLSAASTGVGSNLLAGGGGGGTPGGSSTQLQFNNSGSFGGISTVTWDGSNISLGAIGNVKITGGNVSDVITTDSTGNLSFKNIVQTLLVGTRAGAYTVPVTNYTFQVTTRTGNVTVYVN